MPLPCPLPWKRSAISRGVWRLGSSDRFGAGLQVRHSKMGGPQRRRGAHGHRRWSAATATASAVAATSAVAVMVAALVGRNGSVMATPAQTPEARSALGASSAVAVRETAAVPTSCVATVIIQFFYTNLRVFAVR